MNPRGRNFSLLGAAFFLVLGLAWLRHDFGPGNGFPWLLLPLILLGGYSEGIPGALGLSLLSAAAAAFGAFEGLVSREAASVEVLVFALTFGTTALLVGKYEAWQRFRTSTLLPEDAKLIQVERKAHMIRGQIEELEARLKSLAQLYEAAKKLVGILELGPLLDEARTLVARTLPGHLSFQTENEVRLAFYIPEEDNRDLHRVEARGHEISDEGLPPVLSESELRGWCGAAFNPIRVRDLVHDARFRGGGLVAFRSLLVVPLVIQETLSGAMLLASEASNAFSVADFNQAGVLGKQIVFALRKALLYREVQKLSITDNLTGLYVHRHFQERFREELGRAERYRHALGLILLDLDNFKCVNDEHGHPVGDAVLAEAAARLREAAGATALVARYGGEEFAVLLPGANKGRALAIARDLNEALKATPIDVGGACLTVTISGGVASYPEDALTREALVESADEALYAAKRSGRDRVAGYALRR